LVHFTLSKLLVEPIFERDFSQHSYGFISGRSQHQAVQMAQHIVSSGKPYVVDIDLRGVVTSSEEGAVQGSPLSPLLSNIVLDEVDQELEKRGLEFCRFADDCNIFVKSQKAADRVMEKVSQFIEKKLKLKVNRDKSQVAKSDKVKWFCRKFR
jgi:retron-type reverse transcriptase